MLGDCSDAEVYPWNCTTDLLLVPVPSRASLIL